MSVSPEQQELLDLANQYEPQLVPIFQTVFYAGGKVLRRKSGSNIGALYISMSQPQFGADYSKWQLLNCGDNLKAYQRLQQLSRTVQAVSPEEETLAEVNPEALVIPGAGSALVGYAERCSQPTLAVYDYHLLIEHFMSHGMTYEQAHEWVEFNVIGAWLGPGTPLILTRFESSQNPDLNG